MSEERWGKTTAAGSITANWNEAQIKLHKKGSGQKDDRQYSHDSTERYILNTCPFNRATNSQVTIEVFAAASLEAFLFANLWLPLFITDNENLFFNNIYV